MTYIPLSVHTHYSLQLGLSKPKDIAERCKALGISCCAITDCGTIAGSIAFLKEMQDNNIKAILGCELFVTQYPVSIKENNPEHKIILICKDLIGWKNLIKIVSESNDPNFFYKKPRLDLATLASLIDKDHTICITGHYGSQLWHLITSDNELKADADNIFNDHMIELSKIFGSDNIFIGIQNFDNFYNQQTINKYLREICKTKNYQPIALIDSYYAESLDAVDQRILLCSSLKSTASNDSA